MLAMIRGSIAVLIALAVPYAAPAQPTAGAQGTSQEPIPRELALALLNLGQGSGGMDIRVGKAPDNVPPELVPFDAELLGSMTQFDNSVIVVAMPLPPDSAISTLESRLFSLGWTKPPVPTRVPRGGGFVPADNGVGFERPDIVCRGDEFVTFSGSYRRMSGSVIRLNYNRGGRYSACRTQQEAFRSPYEDAPIPTLRAPDGAMTTGGGGMSASTNQVSLSTQLSTRLDPAAVIAHYDKQMRMAGWESTSEGAAPTVAAHTYRKKDEKDRTWLATLISIAVPDGLQQDVMLRLTRR